jgi:dTMP kinase
VKEGMARAGSRRGSDNADRFEKDDLKVQEVRRRAFLEIARLEPHRCRVIDASREISQISHEISFEVARLITPKKAAGKKD